MTQRDSPFDHVDGRRLAFHAGHSVGSEHVIERDPEILLELLVQAGTNGEPGVTTHEHDVQGIGRRRRLTASHGYRTQRSPYAGEPAAHDYKSAHDRQPVASELERRVLPPLIEVCLPIPVSVVGPASAHRTKWHWPV